MASMKYKKSKITLALLATTALSACGGSGGGDPAYTDHPIRNAYYSLPIHQGSIDPLAGSDTSVAVVYDTYISDIDGDGARDDVIFAGRQTATQNTANWVNSRISMMSFVNGRLVDKTSQWFSGTDNIILGTEPDIEFTDFFKTGRNDMFVSHSTDNNVVTGPAHVFQNTGSNFVRIDIPTVGIWSHDSDVGDLNNDTYDDIIMLDYGPNTTIALNNTINGFTTYIDTRGINGHLRGGGSGVAIGNFMRDGGNNEIIVSDASCPLQYLNVAGCSNANQAKMFSVDFTNSTLTYTFIKDLPTSAYAVPNDHQVRVVNYDFNEDGTDDVIVFSRPSDWLNEQSDIQFLQNDGSGNFTDTTSNILTGYDRDSHSTYQPKFLDINGDGKEDILVSSGDYDGANDSHQFLIKTQDNKYVAARQNMLTNFIDEAQSILGGNADNSGATVNIFRGDDGNEYLVTFVPYQPEGDTRLAVFMSRLDGTTISAGVAVGMLQQAWPYLSATAATQALLDTSTSYAGGNVIDVEKAYNPLGALAMKGANLTGFVAGINIGEVTGVATDILGRGYNVNLAQSNVNSTTTMYNTIDSVGGAKFRTGDILFSADIDSQQVSIGTSVYKHKKFDYSVHVSSLYGNPWIDFSGVWGDVTSSTVIDNVVSYTNNKFSVKGSMMYVTTNFTPGLITNVSAQTGAWAEASYTNGRFNADIGVHPVALSGNVSASIPTSINSNGITQYTDYKFGMPSDINTYIRGEYTTPYKQGALKITAAMSQTGEHTAGLGYTIKW
jgi:hypothetical protein